MVAAFALAVGGRGWLNENGSEKRDLRPASKVIKHSSQPELEPLAGTHPSNYLALAPAHRLLQIAQWAARAPLREAGRERDPRGPRVGDPAPGGAD